MATVAYTNEEPNGLATMLGGLIDANLQAHPERERLLRQSVVAVTAPDAGVSVTLSMSPGRVDVSNGVNGRPDLTVQADSDTLIELSSVPLRFGLPDSMTKEGREVNQKLFNGKLKVKGMTAHLGALTRFNRLLSVR